MTFFFCHWSGISLYKKSKWNADSKKYVDLFLPLGQLVTEQIKKYCDTLTNMHMSETTHNDKEVHPD